LLRFVSGGHVVAIRSLGNKTRALLHEKMTSQDPARPLSV
jgi:hypothetical protein